MLYGKSPVSHRTTNSGFTLVELIVTMVLVAILAAYITPRFSTTGLSQRGYHDQALAALRYAQKQAVTADCTTTFTLTSTTECTVEKTGCTGSPTVNNPAIGNANFCNGTTAGSVSGGPVYFDHIGRPLTAFASILRTTDQTISIDGTTITVTAYTGLIR